MKHKLIYTAGIISLLLSFFFVESLLQKETHQPLVIKPDVPRKTVTKKVTLKKVSLKKFTTNKVMVKTVSFAQLPGWKMTNIKKSLQAFQVSCKTFLNQEPTHSVGSTHIALKAKDWRPACREALSIDPVTADTARSFFENWFRPIEFSNKKTVRGLFTGYYMPSLQGRKTRTKSYKTPIYGLPTKMKGKLKCLSCYTREKIDKGALIKKAPVIAWIKSPIDRLFLEIEGSGVVQLPGGKSIYLGYAGENGAPYTSIAGVLIRKGILTKDGASTQAIKQYLEKHPNKMKGILNKNKSFVFFQDLKQSVALGAGGITLTPGYSLAIDKKWIPLGAPLWLDTTTPEEKNDKDKQLHRLMIAQDTGGAIRGLVRGDVYWGAGKKATFLAGHMQNKGHYWLLLPKILSLHELYKRIV